MSSVKAHQYGGRGHTPVWGWEYVQRSLHKMQPTIGWLQRQCCRIGVTDVWQVLIFKTPMSPLQGKVEDREDLVERRWKNKTYLAKKGDWIDELHNL